MMPGWVAGVLAPNFVALRRRAGRLTYRRVGAATQLEPPRTKRPRAGSSATAITLDVADEPRHDHGAGASDPDLAMLPVVTGCWPSRDPKPALTRLTIDGGGEYLRPVQHRCSCSARGLCFGGPGWRGAASGQVGSSFWACRWSTVPWWPALRSCGLGSSCRSIVGPLHSLGVLGAGEHRARPQRSGGWGRMYNFTALPRARGMGAAVLSVRPSRSLTGETAS